MRKKKKGKEKRKRSENINSFILINRQTDRQTDRQTERRTDRHKSFTGMRYNTEQYSKSDSIESNRIESIWNNVE